MLESQNQPVGAEETGAREALDPREGLRLLSDHRGLIVAVTAIALAIAAAINWTSTPFYRATARILIERDNARVMSFQDIYNLGTGTDDYYLTQYQILESRSVAETAFAALGAEDREWFVARGRDPVRELLAIRRIRPVTKSRLVDVEAEHPDPAAARRIVDAMVAAYVSDGQQRRSSASSLALERLKADAEDLQAKLLVAEGAAQRFKTDHEIISMDDRRNLLAARLETQTEQLAEIERRSSEARARLSSVRETLGSDAAPTGQALAVGLSQRDLPEVLQSPVIANCKKELLEARAELSELERSYKPRHPRIVALQNRIASLEQQTDAEVRAVVAALTRESQRCAQEEQELKARIAEQKTAMLDMESRAIQYEMLHDEADNTRRLYEAILSRLKEVEIIDEHDTTNVHRIGTSEVTMQPVRPRKLLNLAFAALVGLVVAAGLALLVEMADRSVKSPVDAARILATPVLGLVPRIETSGGAAATTLDCLDARSSVAEAFRTIRTALSFSEMGRSMRSVVVTSAAPSEGKSMVSVSLAASYARAGKRVLLVDADMRRPRLHRVFDVRAEEGFPNLLLGGRDPRELATATGVEGLWIMTCPVLPPNPVELLTEGVTPELMARLYDAFDLVVFDTPPAGLVSDAVVLGTTVDRVLFVVRSFSTDRGLARRAMSQLRNVGCRVAGLILNHADQRAERYSRYSYGYSNYAYSTDGKATRRTRVAEDVVLVPGVFDGKRPSAPGAPKPVEQEEPVA